MWQNVSFHNLRKTNAAQILLLTDFQAKERLLAVYMSFSVCKLFCCFLTGWIEGAILLAIMNSLLRCLHDLATELIEEKNNVQVWQTVQVLYFGAREHFLFIIFILLLNYVASNAFGIWNLTNKGRVWPTEWHTCYRTLLLDAFLDIASFKPWHE